MLQFKLGYQFQGMIIGRCGEMAFFEEGVDRRPNGRGECANIFILHGSGRRRARKSPAGAGLGCSVPSQTQEEVDGVGTIEPYAIPRNCELIIAPNREKPRAASARSLTPFLEPRSLRLWPV